MDSVVAVLRVEWHHKSRSEPLAGTTPSQDAIGYR